VIRELVYIVTASSTMEKSAKDKNIIPKNFVGFCMLS